MAERLDQGGEIEVLNSSQHPEFVGCEKSEVIPEKAPRENLKAL